MTYEIAWCELPMIVRCNLMKEKSARGDWEFFYDELSKVNACQPSNLFVFDSEACYTWFLLRWS